MLHYVSGYAVKVARKQGVQFVTTRQAEADSWARHWNERHAQQPATVFPAELSVRLSLTQLVYSASDLN